MDNIQKEAIAVSSRIRLARNLADLPFAGRMTVRQRQKLMERAGGALTSTGQFTLTELTAQNRLLAASLVERHHISPAFAALNEPHGAAVSTDGHCHVMLGEEDHLRIQVLEPGLNLETCLGTAVKLDELLDSALPIAFDAKLGYLTACPTNLGTGLRASVMLHLPALTETGQLRELTAAAAQMGLAVRGIYGEGSTARGYFYQFSNQTTLGLTEDELVMRLKRITESVLEREQTLRATWLRTNEILCADRVFRAYGLLQSARRCSAEEATGWLSDALLGVSLQLLPMKPDALHALLTRIQPATLQIEAGRELSPEERDAKRADILRQAMFPAA